jgi:cytochrome-b5 reductase
MNKMVDKEMKGIMAPPPNRAPKTTSSKMSVSFGGPMNDTTMPPPKARSGPRKRKPAVNPRSRFGLGDWKRLLSNSNDLAQRKGAPLRRDIPMEEVRKHNKNYDAWVILRGRVYNIGPYLPYHPGGIDIFKSVLGKDATRLFDKYHRWVSIEGLIGPLLLGTVAISSSISISQYTAVPPKEQHLTNPPRIPVQSVATKSSSLLKEDDEDDEEEPYFTTA